MVNEPEKTELIHQFINRAELLGAVVEKVADLKAASGFISNFCAQNGIKTIVGSPGAKALFEKTIPFFNPAAARDWDRAQAGVVVADFGIAETGTLVHILSSDEEKLAGVLPKICLAVLDGGTIVATPEAIAEVISGHLVRSDKPGPQVAFVSGPSRTADIECQLSLGVHGPASLVILVVLGARP
jgi:L-lactate dehydrogenase complex protein LldG